MSSIDRSNTARNLFPSTATQPAADNLDALVRRACPGDRAAADRVVRALRPRLVAEARKHLGHASDADADAEDVAQDVLLAVLECRMVLRPAPGAAIAQLLRLAASHARRRAAAAARDWGLDE